MRHHPAFGSRPGDLLRYVRQVGSIQVSIHRSCFEAHGGHRKVLIEYASVRVILKQEIDRPVDLLTNTAAQALSGDAAGRGKFLRPLLFQAGP